MTHTVTFEPWGISVPAEEGTTLLEAARAVGVPMGAVCAGRGTCGKCRVLLPPGALSEPAPAERRLLASRALQDGERLACMTRVTGALSAYVVVGAGHAKSSAPPLPQPFSPDPLVRRVDLNVPPATLEDPEDDAGRLRRALAGAGLQGAPAIDYRAAQDLPEAVRAEGGGLSVCLLGGEVISVRPRASARRALGLAVDLGTTTIAAYLYGLEDAELLDAMSTPNPLSPYGADIISRMVHAGKSRESGERLQRILVKAVNALAAGSARSQGAEARDIEEIVVVGNSGMHHLFLDLPAAGLLRAPYVPALRNPISVKARDIGLALSPGAWLYMPPLIGGFIGSDLLAVAAATRIHRRPGVTLALDIGTNTELILSAGGSLTSCSTASGPALEGAALAYGSQAVPGAIDRVWLTGTGARPSYSTVGAQPVSGICGSGVMDLLVCLRESGAVSGRGRLSEASPWVDASPDGNHRFILAPAAETSLGADLSISQGELHLVLLAKGAIRAGVDTLLSGQGLQPSDVEEILVAGAFGSHLSVESMLRTGLLPPVPAERVKRIGNAAGTGAAMVLLSRAEREAAAALSGKIGHVELARVPGFTRRFARSQWFPEEAT
jgi:uncharacterized 2Fe-2S/4Fe-4S cluster protein (DUF4445 family)